MLLRLGSEARDAVVSEGFRIFVRFAALGGRAALRGRGGGRAARGGALGLGETRIFCIADLIVRPTRLTVTVQCLPKVRTSTIFNSLRKCYFHTHSSPLGCNCEASLSS